MPPVILPTTPIARSRPHATRAALAGHRVGRLAVGLWLACAGASAVQAQSLQELYDAARGYDASYLSARALADSAQYRAEQAEALLRPSAAAAASVTRTEVDLPRTTFRGGNSTSVGVTGRQPLFNSPNKATVAQARKSLESSRYDLEAAEQDLIVRVAQAYFDVLAAQDALATTRSSKSFITEQLASAKRNFEVGTATITDTREAQARFDLATAQEVVADNDLRTKRAALDQLVGRSGVAPRTLAVPVALPAVVPPSIDDWLARADTHPTVRRAQIGLEVAKLETDKARGARLPTVDAVGQVNSGYNSLGLTSLPGTTNTASIGLQLNMTLYSGGQIQNRVQETVLLQDKSRNDLDVARRAVTLGTRQAFLGVQSGLAQVKALEAAESSSKLALEATQLGYRVGVRVNLDVLNAQSQLVTTQRDLARARYDVLVGGLRLRQASGQLTPADVAAVSQLLAK